MSHLRAPAARADRREGGRHGRPVPRTAPAPAETHIRPQLLRLAVLPPTAVALSACAVVLFTVRSTGTRPGPVLWAVVAGAVAVTGVGILVAAVAADRAARSVGDRIAALRRSSARGEADLRALVETLRRGEVPERRKSRGGPPGDADDFELLAADLARAHEGAVTAVVQASQLSSQAGSEQKLEVFVNLARRLQSLVHREISILDELENEIEDPELLKGLFHVDHLATRIRRHAENLAVLGGAVSRRQWSNPVSMTEVLRSAIAEVEQYSRVKLVPPIDGELRGHAVADVIHLLAELAENATVFSAPHTQVLLRANLCTSGLAVEVEDRGLGMPVEEQARMNALLADPDQVNVGRLLADGRIGLFVVSQLARRHGIRVRLQSNIYGGVQAVLVVPQALLGGAAGAVGPARDPFPQDTSQGNQRPAPVAPRDAVGPARRPALSSPASGTTGVDRPPVPPQGQDRGRPPLTSPGRDRGGQPLTPQGRDRGRPPLTPQGQDRGRPPLTSQGQPQGAARQPLTPQGQSQGAARPPVPSEGPGAARQPLPARGQGTARRTVPPQTEDTQRPPLPSPAQGAGGTDHPSVSSRPQSAAGTAGSPPTPPHTRSTSEPTGSRVPTRPHSGPDAADPTASPHPGPGPTSRVTRSVTSAREGNAAFAAGGSTAPGHPGSSAGASPSATFPRSRDAAGMDGPTGAGRLGSADGASLQGAPARALHSTESALTSQLRSASGQGQGPGFPAVSAAPGGPVSGELSAPHGNGPGGPAPLPVRGARHDRPNPAEAVPGIRSADRGVVEENAGTAPVPRTGPVRGTMAKPQLPRRRAQEHIVPQLRGGPAPRPDAEQPAGHDPGLMAAFQRGMGLAEAQQSLEAEVLESAVPLPEWEAVEHSSYPASAPFDTTEVPSAHAPAAPQAYGVRDGLAAGPARAPGPASAPGPGSGSGSDHPTLRHDGSAPAG
ncbi:ATP-binding protein [Streptomyces sp. T028]|uniref:sensor histidine kinase n=1 Tax=Streptomyces sp. T028 TaxID=3394379 RepID=UPI003A88110C